MSVKRFWNIFIIGIKQTNKKYLSNCSSKVSSSFQFNKFLIVFIIEANNLIVSKLITCVYTFPALRLEVGDIVKVTKMSMNGQWEGELSGKMGHFPFTHVEFIDSESGIEEDHS